MLLISSIVNLAMALVISCSSLSSSVDDGDKALAILAPYWHLDFTHQDIHDGLGVIKISTEEISIFYDDVDIFAGRWQVPIMMKAYSMDGRCQSIQSIHYMIG